MIVKEKGAAHKRYACSFLSLSRDGFVGLYPSESIALVDLFLHGHAQTEEAVRGEINRLPGRVC